MHHADRTSGHLFSSDRLSDLLDRHRAAVKAEVDQIDGCRLLNTAPADLEAFLVEKFHIEPVVLRKDEWVADAQETSFDARRDPTRYVSDSGRPVMIPAQQITVEVPFSGEAHLLRVQPSTFNFNPPRALLQGSKLVLSFVVPHNSEKDVRQEIDREFTDIEQYLAWQRPELDAFNRALPALAQSVVSARRERLLRDQGRLAGLGIPLKERKDAPRTYAVPDVRRRAVPTLPPANSAPYLPEPTLEMGLYEHILSVLQHMVHVMERSPSAFARMGEEDLRQHFLVQLNAQFEGAATGETFNMSGKTDILLRAGDRNVFIAECKFWKGPKQFHATIDQLLGYLAWRDTKSAILVFNRGTAMSTVLAGVQEVSSAHPQFKRAVEWKHESGFRYVFSHLGDSNREIVCTVLVIDVPGTT